MEKWYLIKLLTNTAGQDGSSIGVFPSRDKALVSYHQTLAAYHNAEDVLYAVVKIENYEGVTYDCEIVDHRPEPETQPEE